MEKKFYEMPEVEVINLDFEGAILGPSDGSEDPLQPPVLDGDGDSSEMG